MITAGVDLASKPASTALCVIDWSGPTITALEVGVDDERILDVAADVDRLGIDAPFGWPDAFVDATTRWHAGGDWPTDTTHADALRSLRFRVTDLVVHDEIGRWPLSVSTDLIGVPTFRCVRLLTEMRRAGIPIDRSGVAGRVVESYPAGALHRWGLAARGYKGSRGTELRATIVDDLASRLPDGLTEPCADALAASDDALDAFVAALIARAATLGLTAAPPPELTAVAEREGWIHLPSVDAFERLADAD